MKIEEINGWRQPGGSACVGGPYVQASDYPKATFKGIETYKDAKADHLVVKGEHNGQQFKVFLVAELDLVEKTRKLLLANIDRRRIFADIGELDII